MARGDNPLSSGSLSNSIRWHQWLNTKHVSEHQSFQSTVSRQSFSTETLFWVSGRREISLLVTFWGHLKSVEHELPNQPPDEPLGVMLGYLTVLHTRLLQS